MSSSRFYTVAALVTMAIIQLAYVLVFYRKGIYADQWDLVPMLNLYLSGGDWLNEALSQHEGHYLTVAYLIMLPLASVTGWSLLAEIWVLLSLNIAAYFLLYQAFLKRLLESNDRLSLFTVLIFSLMYFSLSHGGNALWSWQIAVYLVLFSVALMAHALGSQALGPAKFSMGLTAAFIASFSFSCGFAVWPAGGLILLLRDRLTVHERLKYLAIWVVACLLMLGYFLMQMESDMTGRLQVNVVDSLLFLLYYLGTPIAYFSRDLTLLVAVLGLLSYAYWGLRLWVALPRSERTWFVGVLAMAAFAIVSGVLISIGRLELGVDQARSFRYIIFAQFFWFSWLLFLWRYCRQFVSQASGSKGKSFKWPLSLLAILIIFNGQKIGRSSAAVASQDNQFHVQAAAMSDEHKRLALLTTVGYPSRDVLIERLATLKAHKLAFYRD